MVWLEHFFSSTLGVLKGAELLMQATYSYSVRLLSVTSVDKTYSISIHAHGRVVDTNALLAGVARMYTLVWLGEC